MLDNNPGGVMRCLIVDDDHVCRLLLRAVLQPHFTIVEAANGREAIEAMRATLVAGNRFDLVTLDVMMPDLDGQTTLVVLRALEDVKGIQPGKGAMVIMTTALGDSRNVLTAFREQATSYLVKPLDMGKLRGLLREQGLLGTS